MKTRGFSMETSIQNFNTFSVTKRALAFIKENQELDLIIVEPVDMNCNYYNSTMYKNWFFSKGKKFYDTWHVDDGVAYLSFTCLFSCDGQTFLCALLSDVEIIEKERV